jgi:hypothetical protein
MRLQIDRHYGVDGTAHRLAGTLDGEPVELRALSLTTMPDALARLEDVAALLEETSDPLLPYIYGVATLDDWAALVVAETPVPTLHDISHAPVPVDVATSILCTIAHFVERVHLMRDAESRPLNLSIGALCSSGIRIGKNGGIFWCWPESLAGVVADTPAVQPTHPTGGPEDDVYGLGVLLLEMLAGTSATNTLLRELATLDDAPSHHRRLRAELGSLRIRDDLARLVEQLCSYHSDERPDATRIIDVTSGFQLDDDALVALVDARAETLQPSSNDHPLVGLEFGERTPSAPNSTMGPEDWSDDPPIGRPPPRPELPEPPRRRFETGGATVFERRVPKQTPPPAAPRDRTTPPAAASATPAYVPPAQLDTPDLGGTRSLGWIGWVLGGGCATLLILSVGGVIAIAAGIGAASLF